MTPDFSQVGRFDGGSRWGQGVEYMYLSTQEGMGKPRTK